MDSFYTVAQVDLEPEYPHSTDWPKVIAYSYKKNSFLLTEGKGHGFKGVGSHRVRGESPHLESFIF